jgi:hypothetical protein
VPKELNQPAKDPTEGTDSTNDGKKRYGGDVLMSTKERPILFSGPMVRAILQGRKTQTRRIIKPDWSRCLDLDDADDRGKAIERCLYGQPGDRLWVRETWTPDHAAFYPNFPCVYRADAGYEYDRNEKGETYSIEQKAWYPYRWRPSIFMPRWASRITLEITGVRVERLQDISEADAIAEGCAASHPSIDAISREFGYPDFARSQFAQLWESINGLDSWSATPWVWVVEFNRLEATQ